MRPLALICLLSGCATGLQLPARHARGAEWSRLSGPLFDPGGPSPDDVYQGDLGDCSMMAQLIALAANRPEVVRGIVQELADGTFDVRLFSGDGPRVVNVDRQFPTERERLLYAGEAPRDYWAPGARGAAASNVRPIWPMVVEKAVATLHGGYQAIDTEKIEIATELSGWRSVWLKLSLRPRETSLSVIREALLRNFAVRLGNAPPEAAQNLKLRPRHAYAVMDVFDRDGRAFLTLRNPTGERPMVFELAADEALTAFSMMGLSGEALTEMVSIRIRPEEVTSTRRER